MLKTENTAVMNMENAMRVLRQWLADRNDTSR